jgi:2-hydroxy-3-oxopropionate reductase
LPEKVGFIGLGIMGKPMALNLLRAGYDLTIHNRSRSPVGELVAAGATAADSPREVGASCDVIFTMLPDSSVVEEVVVGKDGILEGSKPGNLIIDCSTISPSVARDLANKAHQQKIGILDAPVSGGDVGAQEGILSIMVGGTEKDLERARPLFEVLGKSTVHVGDNGAGQTVKACNQIVIALTIEAVGEALVLGSKAGLDPSKILEVLSGGLASNRIIELRAQKLLTRDFEPGGKVSTHHKDLGIALSVGREYGVSLPVTAIVNEMFGALKSKGHVDKDHTSLMLLLEDWGQHEVGTNGSTSEVEAPRSIHHA